MADIKISFPEILYLFGTFHGIFLGILLITARKSYKANIYLALLLFLFSFYLFENALSSSGYISLFPHLLYTTIPLIYLIAPLFYTYTRSLLIKDFKLRLADGLHLVPFVTEVIILAPFYFLSAEIKLKIYSVSLSNTAAWTFNIYFFGYILYILSALGYFFASFRLLSKARKEEPGRNGQLVWLRQSSLALFGYVAISLVFSVLLLFDGGFRTVAYNLNLIMQMVLIQGVGYVAFMKPQVFRNTSENGSTKKYRFSSLDPKTMANHKLMLLEVMKAEPYLDPDLSPEQLAGKLGISKHHFSQLLTEALHTNFYDFINQYRVEKAKQLLALENYRDAKILHIAYDSGFSNKSTFLRSFRKLTGITPSEFKADHTFKV